MTEWRLHRQEQEYYTLPDLAAATATGNPVSVAVDGWEASFDRGVTWHQSQAHPDQPTAPCWLLRGDQHPGPGDTNTSVGILVTRTIAPLVRRRDTPETVIEQAPMVQVWS